MRRVAPAAALLLAACSDANETSGRGNAAAEAQAPANQAASASPAPGPDRPAAAARWQLQSSAEGTALALGSGSGAATLRLLCPAGGAKLLVSVPAFTPVGSEERLSFGSGGEVVALVADPRGDRVRGGVSGAGPAPANLAALIAAPLAVNYGAQDSGPHPAPPPHLARAFVAACTGAKAAATPPAAAAAGACMMQGAERLTLAPLRAVGTEPFWGARIEGRCVTYSHPDDQAGTRVWTRYAARPGGGGGWSGTLGGRPFELVVRPERGCSDGMSDKSYPLAVALLVGGERRQGCAEPA